MRSSFRRFPAFGAVALLATSGCIDQVMLELPEASTAQSLLILIEESGLPGTTSGLVIAKPVGEAAEPMALPPEGELFVLMFPWSLETLGVEPGPIAAAAPGAGRPIPTPEHSFRLEHEGSTSWVETDPTQSALFQSFRLPVLSDVECANKGGCYDEHPLGLCVVPCPDPTPPEPIGFETAPDPPELPVLTPCPATWTEVEDSDPDRPTICEPFVGGRPRCESPEAAFFGGCAKVGSECPTDGWPADLPASADTRYVRPSAPPGGSGTKTAPFSRIEDAMQGAPSGAVIALSVGSYDEQVRPPPGVSLFGACAEGTVIQPNASIAADSASVVVEQGDAEIANLTVLRSSSSTLANALLVSGATLNATELIAQRVAVLGGGALQGSRLLLEDATENPLLVVVGGARAEVEELALEQDGSCWQAVFVGGPTSSATITRASAYGGEFLATEGANLTLDQASVAESHASGVAVVSGAKARVSNLFVSGTHPQVGLGAFIADGELELHRATFRGPDTQGIEAHRANVKLSDVALIGVGNASHAGAISSYFGSLIDGTRVNIFGGYGWGIRTGWVDENDGCEAEPGDSTLTDLVVAGLRYVIREEDGAPIHGKGIEIACGGRLDIQRAIFDDNDAFGVELKVAEANIADAVFANGQGQDEPGHGGDALVARRSKVVLSRALFSNNRGRAIEGVLGSDLTLSDLRISTQGRGGICLDSDSTPRTHAEIERVTLFDNAGAGLIVAGGAEVPSATDLVIERTSPNRVDDDCDGFSCAGNGIVVQHSSNAPVDSSLEASRFFISDSTASGIVVTSRHSVRLSDGRITKSALAGAQVLDEESLRDLMNRVVFEDNEVSVSFDAQ